MCMEFVASWTDFLWKLFTIQEGRRFPPERNTSFWIWQLNIEEFYSFYMAKVFILIVNCIKVHCVKVFYALFTFSSAVCLFVKNWIQRLSKASHFKHDVLSLCSFNHRKNFLEISSQNQASPTSFRFREHFSSFLRSPTMPLSVSPQSWFRFPIFSMFCSASFVTHPNSLTITGMTFTFRRRHNLPISLSSLYFSFPLVPSLLSLYLLAQLCRWSSTLFLFLFQQQCLVAYAQSRNLCLYCTMFFSVFIMYYLLCIYVVFFSSPTVS